MDFGSVTLSRVELQQRTFVTKVYGWMTVALVITAVVALAVVNTPSLARLFLGNPALLIGLCIGELALVFVLSAAMGRLAVVTAMYLFLLYSALNGITLSGIFLVFTAESIATTFFVTAGMFAAVSAYGYFTKADLTTLGSLCFMTLIGVIIASVVNVFLGSTRLNWIITYVGILVFVGLTAYDTQKIKVMGQAGIERGDEQTKGAILGALALYLDFINLFLLLLRLFGRRD